MTELSKIADMMSTLVPMDYKELSIGLLDIVRHALLQYSLRSGQDFAYVEPTATGVVPAVLEETQIIKTMSLKEKYIVSQFAYSVYLSRLIDEFNRGAINFKTITFEVNTLQERVKSAINMLKLHKISMEELFQSYMSSAEFTDDPTSTGSSFTQGVIVQVEDKDNYGWQW